ncbi:PAS domain S-box protein [Salinibaculum salinum]|uniref:PAS domain S-box protein n=1 Tax=Salinibaculum salinum TaxID=3131996 RepID=UPI0030EFA4EE
MAAKLGLDDSTALSVATTLDNALTHLAENTVDCILLCDHETDRHERIAAVRTLRDEHSAVPIVAFVGRESADGVDATLQAGATDIIQSTSESVSQPLLERRIESAVEANSLQSKQGRQLERYETLLNTAVDAIYQLDTDRRIVAVNDATVELTGYDRSELLGSEISLIMSEEDIQRGDRKVAQALKDQKDDVQSLEITIHTKGGREVPCEARIAVLRRNGDFDGTVGVVRDIADQREREQKLRERDELLRYLSENINDVVWITSPDSDGMSFVSAAYKEIWGQPRETLYEDSEAFLERIHPDDRDRVEDALERQKADPDSYDETYRIVQPDGEIRWIHSRTVGVYEGGQLERIIGVARDITERRQAQAELMAERDMFAQGPAVVFKWENAKGWPVEYVSENVEELMGYTPDEFQSDEVAYEDLIHDDDIERVIEEAERHSDGTTDRFSHDPYRVVTSSGEVRWVTDSTKIIRDGDDILYYLGYLVDITERKEREQELRALKEEYEMMVETVGDVVYVLDEDYYFVSVSGAAETVTGYTCEELEGAHMSKILSDEELERGQEDRQKVIDGETETGDIEVELIRQDGTTCPVEFRYRKLPVENEFRGTAGVIRDISERNERERKIANQRDNLAQLDRLNAVIRDVDQALVAASSREEIEQAVCERLTSAGRYEFALTLHRDPEEKLTPGAWTEAAEEYVDEVFPIDFDQRVESPGLQALENDEVESVRDLVEHTDAVPPSFWEKFNVRSLAAVPITYGDHEYGVVAVYGNETDAFSERELEVLGELGETIGYAIAAVERREREQTLTSLYEATRDLLGTTTEQEVSDVVVDVAADVLDLLAVGLFLFDDEENVLEPISATESLYEFYGDSTIFGPGRTDSETWQTYATGERKVFDDIRMSDRPVSDDTDGRGALFLPLGDHGVLVAASEEVGTFDDTKRKLMGLLAATTETALDRVAGQASLRERDKALAQQTEKLELFDHINGILRDVADTLVQSSSRADIEQAVCDRLVTEDEYAFAWIGVLPPDGTTVEPRTWTGDGTYLDSVSATVGSGEPTARTATENDVTVVENVTDHLRDDEWAQTAAEYGYQSVLSVPLPYGETSYGVLTVYANEPDAFDETTRAVFTDLGKLVGYGLNVAETKQGILAEEVTELELEIGTPGTFLNAVAGLAGTAVQYRETTPDSNGTTRVLFEISDPPVEDILALESEFVAVESLTHVERSGSHLFRATLNGDTVAGTLLESGGIPQHVEAHADYTRAVVRLPQQLSVREFLARVQKTYPETELRSRHERTNTETGDSIRFTLGAELTDRQREVLVTAYESGFFESPRETTGAELADLLDVSQPTVTHHLREAQRRLFAELFGDETEDDI